MPKIWKKLLFCVTITGLGSLGVASAAVTDQLESPAGLEARNPEAAPPPPSILFGQLFRDVELGQVFKDQKTFCDLIPTQKPAQILAEYSAEKTSPSFSVSAFVAAHFRMQTGAPVVLPAAPGVPVQTYIAGLWNVLQEQTGDVDDIAPYSSLLRLPRPFVVPGGRFLEMYYWDSYFTMLGLEADGRHDIARNMVDDFAYEIDHYGHIPNGNRTYYLSRSQPPFFSKMVDLMASREGEGAYVRYLPELEREYDYWMKGANALPAGRAYRNVVRLPNGVVLNRYWDARDVPRDESYREDIITAQTANRPAPELWRNLRATAESGWDFSSRWLGDGQHLATVETLNLLPVDLNSLMEHLERTIARGYALKGELRHAHLFEARACERAAVIRSLMWDRRLHLFSDFRWTDGQLTHRVTAATLYPLFFHIADRQQGVEVARAVAGELLMPNGVATTTVFTSTQQWDQPNGWAPLQWIAVSGFNAYGEKPLAKAIAERWMHANLTVFYATGKLVEKYDLITASGGAGGEYATQIGFGWTNGVLRQLMTLYPRL